MPEIRCEKATMQCLHAVFFKFVVIDASHQNSRFGWRMVNSLNPPDLFPDLQTFSINSSSEADLLSDKRAKEKKIKEESIDGMDLSDLDKNSRDSLAIQSSIVPSGHLSPLNDSQSFNEVDSTISMVDSLETLPTKSSKNAEISACVVCDKRFKSKSYMNKHLRTVHTGE